MTIRESIRSHRDAVKNQNIKVKLAYFWEYHGIKTVVCFCQFSKAAGYDNIVLNVPSAAAANVPERIETRAEIPALSRITVDNRVDALRSQRRNEESLNVPHPLRDGVNHYFHTLISPPSPRFSP